MPHPRPAQGSTRWTRACFVCSALFRHSPSHQPLLRRRCGGCGQWAELTNNTYLLSCGDALEVSEMVGAATSSPNKEGVDLMLMGVAVGGAVLLFLS